nr:MAG TPA_asm: hypothetical protein [Caudoviricetes sp.]
MKSPRRPGVKKGGDRGRAFHSVAPWHNRLCHKKQVLSHCSRLMPSMLRAQRSKAADMRA